MTTISKAIQQAKEAMREHGKADAYEVYNGKVSAVSEADTICDVDIDPGVTIPGVRLRAVITDDKGVWVLPKVGSDVVIAKIEGGTDYALLQASEVDKYIVKIGSMSFEMDANGGVFNGGTNGGIPMADPVTEKLNNIEKDLNDLKTALLPLLGATAVPIPEPGSGSPSALQAALITALTTWITANFILTTTNDIENPDLSQ